MNARSAAVLLGALLASPALAGCAAPDHTPLVPPGDDAGGVDDSDPAPGEPAPDPGPAAPDEPDGQQGEAEHGGDPRDDAGDGWWDDSRERDRVEPWRDDRIPMHELSPVQAGKRYTWGNCEGEGSVPLGKLPMDPEDVGVIIPYGSTIDGHVTPIDHQYFYPSVFDSQPDAYEVYAPADGTIFYMDSVETPDGQGGDYAIRYTYSCTFFVWYALMTSLTPDLEAVLDEQAGPDGRAYVDIPVEEGQLVGWIGGQTLDYAVLDTTRPLDGFIHPGLYETEATKIFTANPSDYYTGDVRRQAAGLNVRTADPVGGRIDWDEAGTLQGNWFLEDTGGYRGWDRPDGVAPRYWKTHLAIYPDYADPDATIVSIGDFDGEAVQATILGRDTDPSTVTVEDGAVAFTLVPFDWVTPDGTRWDGVSHAEDLAVQDGRHVDGCGLFDVLPGERLEAQFFPGESCDDVEGFTDEARVYER